MGLVIRHAGVLNLDSALTGRTWRLRHLCVIQFPSLWDRQVDRPVMEMLVGGLPPRFTRRLASVFCRLYFRDEWSGHLWIVAGM